MSLKKFQSDSGFSVIAFAKSPADAALNVKVLVVNEPSDERQSFSRRERFLPLTSVVVEGNDRLSSVPRASILIPLREGLKPKLRVLLNSSA